MEGLFFLLLHAKQSSPEDELNRKLFTPNYSMHRFKKALRISLVLLVIYFVVWLLMQYAFRHYG